MTKLNQSNGTITVRKNKTSTRFNAQKQFKGKRYSKLFSCRDDAQDWLDDLSFLGATDSKGNLTRKAKSAQLIIDEIDQQRARNDTPTLQDCISIFSSQCDIPSAAKYVLQISRFTGLLAKPVNEITRLMFEMELDRVQEDRQLSDGTANRYQAAFSSLFKWLARHKDFKQYSLVNPTIGVPRGKEGGGRTLFLTKDQQARLLQACKENRWDGLYPLIYLLLLTGSRRNEIAQLRWENVDFKNKTITLIKTKNGSDHIIELKQEAIKMLKEWKFSQPLSNWVFQHVTNPRAPMTNFDHYWKEVKEAAEMPEGLRIHDLRHSTASTMLQDGFSLEEIQETLNHKSVAMTKRYSHFATVKKASSRRDVDYMGVM